MSVSKKSKQEHEALETMVQQILSISGGKHIEENDMEAKKEQEQCRAEETIACLQLELQVENRM